MNQQSAVHALELDGRLVFHRYVGEGQHAQIMLFFQSFERGFGKGRRYDYFDEDFGNFLRSFQIDFAVGGDDSAENRHGVAGVSLSVCFRNRRPVATPQGLECLTATTVGSSNSFKSSIAPFESLRLL